jgi:hypothetical protein
MLTRAGCAGAMFCGYEVLVGNMHQIGELTHQMVFVLVHMTVGVGNLPHQFDDLNLFFLAKALVY